MAVSIFLRVLPFLAWAESFSLQSPFSTRTSAILSVAAASSSQQNKDAAAMPPSNEFSRTIPPDRIKANSRRSATGRRRDYQMSLSATTEECQALAQRFDLKHIDSLEATVSLRSEYGGAGGLEVEGSVVASVTQTCVRTNEDFPVQLEFPLYSIVRPVVPFLAASSSSSIFDIDDNEDDSFLNDNFNKNNKKQKRNKNNNSNYRAGSTLEDLDVFELQRLLQDDIAMNGDGDESSLMEDEAIYPKGGNIDVGELVAQIFWLSLDPYPKKPGTDPIQTTISG